MGGASGHPAIWSSGRRGSRSHAVAVAVLFLFGYLALQVGAKSIAHHPRWLLIASASWGLYAAWEWLIQIKSPEANIRADLLFIWPVLAVLSVWALFRLFR